VDDTLDQIPELAREAARVAMATLVATRGTTPKKEGAKMWVGADGAIRGGVTIGGCVDARVLDVAAEVLAGGETRLLSLALDDEEAWDLGLSCGGRVDVLVEPVDFGRADDPVAAAYRAVGAQRAAGRRGAIVAPVAPSPGERPRLVVLDDGAAIGSLGAPDRDRAAVERARELTRLGASRTVTLADGEYFVEVHAPPPTLVVFGAGQIAIPLVELAATLGFRTVVADGRARYASRARFPRAGELLVEAPPDAARRLAYGHSTFVVIVAHDYKYEVPILEHVLASEAAYVGVLGNPRRGRALLDMVSARGVPPEAVARVRIPVGLDIGAQSAAEIALAILAEALAVRAGRAGGPMRDRPPG
jgi:xanthine dehydrogenase accessory factor